MYSPYTNPDKAKNEYPYLFSSNLETCRKYDKSNLHFKTFYTSMYYRLELSPYTLDLQHQPGFFLIAYLGIYQPLLFHQHIFPHTRGAGGEVNYNIVLIIYHILIFSIIVYVDSLTYTIVILILEHVNQPSIHSLYFLGRLYDIRFHTLSFPC